MDFCSILFAKRPFFRPKSALKHTPAHAPLRPWAIPHSTPLRGSLLGDAGRLCRFLIPDP
jgi:hypothetical protein